MKIKTLAMMLATTLALTNQECVSASFTIDMEDLINKGDVNIIPNAEFPITHAGAHSWKYSEDINRYQKISKVKYKGKEILAINLTDTFDKNKNRIYMLDALTPLQSPETNITLEVTIPGGIYNKGSHLPVHIGPKAFQYANLMNLSMNLSLVKRYGFSVTMPENCSGLCQGSNIFEIIDIRDSNTQHVTDMTSMYANCARLKKLLLGNNFSMLNCLNKRDNIVSGCTSLQQVDQVTYSNLPQGTQPTPEELFSTALVYMDLCS